MIEYIDFYMRTRAREMYVTRVSSVDLPNDRVLSCRDAQDDTLMPYLS